MSRERQPGCWGELGWLPWGSGCIAPSPWERAGQSHSWVPLEVLLPGLVSQSLSIHPPIHPSIHPVLGLGWCFQAQHVVGDTGMRAVPCSPPHEGVDPSLGFWGLAHTHRAGANSHFQNSSWVGLTCHW